MNCPKIPHPPIPPKSILLSNLEHSIKRMGVFAVACIAEVEWRKRAARWNALAERLMGRMLKRRNGTTGHLRSILRPRRDAYWECQDKALEIAEQWRAWGESK